MLYNDFTEKLLELQDVCIKNIENINGSNIIYAELIRKAHKCPYCGTTTDKIHDYRN